jgi:hypothetical protein
LSFRKGLRQAYDQFRIGSGKAERLCAALIVSSILFLICLLAGGLVGSAPGVAIVCGGVALFLAFIPSVFLILGPPDDQIEEMLTELRQRAAEARVAIQSRNLQTEQPTQLRPAGGIASASSADATDSRTQRCPYCAEEIHAAAVKCKHCGEFLETRLKEKVKQVTPVVEMKRYRASGQVICQFCDGDMFPTIISSGNCLGILVALIVFFGGLFLLLAFFWTCIGAIVGLLMMMAALLMGGKRRSVWRCRNCGFIFERA